VALPGRLRGDLVHAGDRRQRRADRCGRIGALLATAAVAAGAERLLFGTTPARLVERVGLGRPTAGALAITLAVSAACLAVYRLLTLVTGHAAELRDGWPWLLAGLFAYNGLAEELGWRAYAFGRLRRGARFAGRRSSRCRCSPRRTCRSSSPPARSSASARCSSRR
jgi:hypothetical protein